MSLPTASDFRELHAEALRTHARMITDGVEGPHPFVTHADADLHWRMIEHADRLAKGGCYSQAYRQLQEAV